MIYYFSGTGNSYWAATELAKALNDTAVNVVSFKDQAEVVCSDDVVGFVYPVYGSDCPRVYKEFLQKLKVKKDVYAWALATINKVDYGSLESIDQALVENGARLSYGMHFYMPGNCLETPENITKSRLLTAPDRIRGVIRDVKAREVNFVSKNEGIPADFIRRAFGEERTFGSLTASDACTGCGICVKLCPTGNIRLENGKAVHGNDCTICFACFHWCPVRATELHTGFPGLDDRGQYTHPDVKASDLYNN